MPPSISVLVSRWAAPAAALRILGSVGPLLALHIVALVVLYRTEYLSISGVAGFLLAWTLLNSAWLVAFRRPGVAAVLSLTMIMVLIRVSELKYQVVWQTVNFVDVMIIDPAAIAFLLAIVPGLTVYVVVGLLASISVLVLVWRLDPFRLPRFWGVAGVLASVVGLSGLSVVRPFDTHDNWFPNNHVSVFMRSAADAVGEFLRNGYMESDPAVTDRIRMTGQATCEPGTRPPHIIMVHDEFAFDIRNAPNIVVPPSYGHHFHSFDGKQRGLVMEAAGGPSWYAEYNVLAGLSVRSFGRFGYFVTRIAAGRVQRGLPAALRHCGYRTFSLYPAHGAFMAAQRFQASTGIQNFFDMRAMRARDIEPDAFYYEQAMRMLARERAEGPMFVFIYLSANHWPWNYRWQPDLMPDWKDLGNGPVVDEYLRRQTIGMRDYRQFLERLRTQFPGEPFMLVRYGDHQPDFAVTILEPSLPDSAIVERLKTNDPRYYGTYYAIDGVNFRPNTISSTFDTIEAPYLPLAVLESARLPLDPSFAEQKKIFERCRGLFYSCADGAEARRFNRLLIDAGLITGL